MTCRKFPFVFTSSFTLAALMTLASAGSAQTGTAANEGAASPHLLPPQPLSISATGQRHSGSDSSYAPGNFYISAGINSTTHVSGFAVLKYHFNGRLQGAFRYMPMPGESLGSAQAVKPDKQNNIYALGTTSFGGLVTSFTPAGAQPWRIVLTMRRLRWPSINQETSMLPVTAAQVERSCKSHQ